MVTLVMLYLNTRTNALSCILTCLPAMSLSLIWILKIILGDISSLIDFLRNCFQSLIRNSWVYRPWNQMWRLWLRLLSLPLIWTILQNGYLIHLRSRRASISVIMKIDWSIILSIDIELLIIRLICRLIHKLSVNLLVRHHVFLCGRCLWCKLLSKWHRLGDIIWRSCIWVIKISILTVIILLLVLVFIVIIFILKILLMIIIVWLI